MIRGDRVPSSANKRILTFRCVSMGSNYGGNGDFDDEDDNKDGDEGDNDGDDDDGSDVPYNRLFFEGGEKATGLCFNNIQIYSFSKEK